MITALAKTQANLTKFKDMIIRTAKLVERYPMSARYSAALFGANNDFLRTLTEITVLPNPTPVAIDLTHGTADTEAEYLDLAAACVWHANNVAARTVPQ